MRRGPSRRRPERSDGDRRFAAVCCLLSLALSSAPYLYGRWAAPPGTFFIAVPPINSADANQYLAFTRIVREGSLLIHDPFTAEPHAPRLVLPQIYFQAALTLLPGVGVVDAFQISRVVSGALLLAAAWWLIRLVLPDRSRRRLALLLVCFSAGAGWAVDALGVRAAHGDFLQPEGNTFYTLGNLPHLSLSAALLTALFAARLWCEQRVDARPLGVTALLSAGLSWTHPFDFLPLAMGLGAYSLLLVAMDQTRLRSALPHAAAVCLGAAPAGIYLLWLVAADRFYAALAADRLRVQSFAFYAIAHGPLILCALPLLPRPRALARMLLPLAWVVPVFLFLLTPFPLGGKQPRVVGGVHVPLCILAAAGLHSAAKRAARCTGSERRAASPWIRSLVLAPPLLFLLAGTPAALGRQTWYYARGLPDFYLPPELLGALAILDRQARPDGVALAGRYTEGWIPVFAGARMYHGHWHMTLNEERKGWERDWFFTRAADPGARGAWLRDRGIGWVLYWSWEWIWDGRPAAIPLDGVPELQAVYRAGDVALYRVQGRRSPPAGGLRAPAAGHSTRPP